MTAMEKAFHEWLKSFEVKKVGAKNIEDMVRAIFSSGFDAGSKYELDYGVRVCKRCRESIQKLIDHNTELLAEIALKEAQKKN